MRQLLSTVYLLVLLSTPAVSRAATMNLDSLFAVSVGGPAAVDSLRQATSCYAVGKASMNGVPGTFVQYFAPPAKNYMKVSVGGMTITQAFDGVHAWQVDYNGNVS